MRIFIPGDPATTNYIQTLNTIAGLLERPSRMYLTSEHWTAIIRELDAQYMDLLMDPTKPPPWNSGRPIQIGKLLVVNAGTNNQAVVNLKNQSEPGAINFQARKERLRTG